MRVMVLIKANAKSEAGVMPGEKTDGPFAETKELLAGFWIWKVKSMDEAVDWARRIPNPDDEPAEVELRPVGETEDFDMSPELKDREKALYARLAKEAGRR
jgi:hypothetical protein